MKSEEQIQHDVMEELKWEASINAFKPTEIGVAVKGGIVTLSGAVENYSQKLAAEKAALGVSGVRAVVNNIDVEVWSGFKKTDAEIAQNILNAIDWSASIPKDRVKVSVKNGMVTLEGNVEWGFQKESCKELVDDMRGVVGVINNVKVVPQRNLAEEVKEKIRDALQKNATLDADRIVVDVKDNKVILSGEVRSIGEKRSAERAAMSVPGVTEVKNELMVIFSEAYT